MSTSLSPVSAFMDGKNKVLATPVPYIVNMLLVFIVPFFVLFGGLHAMVLVCDKGRRGEPVGPTDVFNLAFDDLANRILLMVSFFAIHMVFLMPSMIAGFVLPPALAMIGSMVLYLISLVVTLVLSMLFPLALVASARERTPVAQAWIGAINRVKGDLGGIGVYNLVTSLIGSLGFFACCVGLLVTYPMAIFAWLAGYEACGGLGSTEAPEVTAQP